MRSASKKGDDGRRRSLCTLLRRGCHLNVPAPAPFYPVDQVAQAFLHHGTPRRLTSTAVLEAPAPLERGVFHSNVDQ